MYVRVPPGVEPHQPHEAAQLREEAVEDREPRLLGDLEVELLVEVDEVLLALLVGGPALADQEQAQQVDVLDADDLRGVAHRGALERLAQQQDLAPVLLGEAAHDQLAACSDLDEPFLQQEPECLADGRARDLQLLGDLAFCEHVADLERAAQDHVAQVLVGRLGEPPAARGRDGADARDVEDLEVGHQWITGYPRHVLLIFVLQHRMSVILFKRPYVAASSAGPFVRMSTASVQVSLTLTCIPPVRENPRSSP